MLVLTLAKTYSLPALPSDADLIAAKVARDYALPKYLEFILAYMYLEGFIAGTTKGGGK
jgi:hypothetical protein